MRREGMIQDFGIAKRDEAGIGDNRRAKEQKNIYEST
jgi:hypothetical protein